VLSRSDHRRKISPVQNIGDPWHLRGLREIDGPDFAMGDRASHENGV
jgi:hypothetical protein